MKINTVIRTFWNKIPLAFYLAVALWLVSAASLFAETQSEEYAGKLSHARLAGGPMLWVGAAPPSEAESRELWETLGDDHYKTFGEAVGALEAFIKAHPDSPWAPSLRGKLGEYYQQNGYSTLALNHWQAAWEATKQKTDDQAKMVANYSLVNYLQSLSKLGQPEIMRVLFDETQGRALPPFLQRQYNQSRKDYEYTQKSPQFANQCGTYALAAVAKTLSPTNQFGQLMRTPAPRTGFSLARLEEMAESNHLGLVAAERPDGQDELVVPSVVHEKQNHYVAIVARKGNWYKVIDPAFQTGKWLRAEAINAEASGHFLVPAKQVPDGWRSLGRIESDQIFGKCFPRDFTPPPCPSDTDTTCPACGGPGGSSSGGSSSDGSSSGGSSSGSMGGVGGVGGVGQQRIQQGCSGSGCSGMPTWTIREPWCDLCLVDEPLAYQPATGPRISFKLFYSEQFGDNSFLFPNGSHNVFNMGLRWNCSWISCIAPDCSPGGPYDSVTLHPPGGGQRDYSDFSGTVPDPDTNTRMLAETNNGEIVGFKVLYPSGAEDIYENAWGPQPLYFLTKQMDNRGRATTFIYTTNNVNNVDFLLLQYVIDADGKTNTLNYTTITSPWWSIMVISQITDPYGHTVTLNYDASWYTLTNVADVASISSSFVYNTSDLTLTNLITPYGINSFYHNGSFDSESGYYVVVTEPNGSHQMFSYVGGKEVGLAAVPAVYTDTGNVPTNRPVDNAQGDNKLDNPDWNNSNQNDLMQYANSFYWGRQQFDNLSVRFLVTAPNWDTSQLTNSYYNNYALARLRHWNQTDGIQTLGGGGQSDSLSMEREPSPDGGTTPGKMTWYDYPGKPYFFGEGTSQFPSLKIRVLPDGSEWYELYQVDQWGNRTNIISTYSINGTVLTRTNSYVYSTNGVDLLRHVGPDGVVQAAYAYTNNHQVLFMTNALGEVTSYTYNTNEQVTSIMLPNGLVTTNIYGNDGYLAQQIVIGISTNSYTHTNGLVYTHTDERGLTVTNTWDALERLTRVAYPDGTSIAYTYSNLDLVRIVDRMGYTNSYGYNSIRQKITETNALGNATFYNYCDCGALSEIIDALNNVTQFVHDNQGNLIQTIYPDGYTINNTYNSIRQLVCRSDSGGNVIARTYNNQGLLVTVSNTIGLVAANTYDINDRLTNSVDVNNVSINTAYDVLGRILTRSYPDNGVEKFGYTLNVSGPTSYTNQIGNVVLYAYDPANRKTNGVYVGVTANKFAFNGAGDLLTLTDGKSQTTTWGYDQYGRVTNKLDALGTNIFIYQYDPDNRLTSRWSAAKGTTVYRYDAVGDLTNVDYSGGTNYTSSIYLSYDKLNRLTNMVDAVGTTAYGYDVAGQLLSEDGPWANDTVSYTYANRLRTGLGLQEPNGAVWNQTYGYDTARRLTGVTSPAGAFSYVLGGASSASPLIKNLLLPNGAYINYTYDSVARLTMTALLDSGLRTLDSYTYGYNQANQRTNVVRTAGDSVNYTYDNMGELITALGSEAGGVTNRLQERLGYAYDAAGNLNYRTNNALVQNFGVNNLNELSTVTRSGTFTVAGTTTSPATNVTVNSLTANLYNDATFALGGFSLVDGMNTFTAIARDGYGRRDTNTVTVNLPATNNFAYDLNGNLLTNGTEVLVWNNENQLVTNFVAGSWKSEFVYDGKFRRRIQRDYSWSSAIGNWQLTNEVRYVYDGNVVIQHRDANNLPTLTLTRGQDLSGTFQGAGGIGGLLAMTENYAANPTHSYYHADGNGNVTMLINANQFIVGKAEYGPFGDFLSLSGTKAGVNPYWYSSKPIHWPSGKYDFLYRWYIPQLDRWPNRDPMGEFGFETLHLVSQPLYVRKLHFAINDFEMQFLLANAIQSRSIDVSSYLRNSHTPYTRNTISASTFFNIVRNGRGAYVPNWPAELLEKNPNLFDFCYNNSVSYVDPNGQQLIPITVGILVGVIIYEQIFGHPDPHKEDSNCNNNDDNDDNNGHNNDPHHGGNGTGGEGSGGGEGDPPAEAP